NRSVTTFARVPQVYANGSNNTATSSVTLLDEDGSHAGAGTLPVGVRNVAPAVALGPDQSAVEGQSVAVAALVTDPGAEAAFTYLWHVTTATGQVIPDATTAAF